MPVLNTAAINQAIADLQAQTTKTVAGEQSAITFIAGVAALTATAVAAALDAQGITDQAVIDAVVGSVNTVRDSLIASADPLAAALAAAGSQPAPPVARARR